MDQKDTQDVRVCVIDYGLGNLQSVRNAFEFLGIGVDISGDASIIADATHLVLPGVGSFAAGMQGLHERGLIDVLKREVVEGQKKILGICLGMQLFASVGFEHGEHEGLGFIHGEVRRIQAGTSLRLPHIGWNNVTINGASCIAQGFDYEPVFYFLHSYHVVPEDTRIITGTCDYGETVVAMVEQNNIMGVQFHPEKSHTDGLQILKNFLAC